jgi:hypothetical protein
VPLRIAENTFREGFGELEGAEVRQQHVGNGDRRRDFSPVLQHEDRRSNRNHQHDAYRERDEFRFQFYSSPLVVKIVSETYDSYVHVFLGSSGYEPDIDRCVWR